MKSPAKSNSVLRILGIDPGSIFCGYGLIAAEGQHARYVTSGRISPPSSQPLHFRLRYIYDALLGIIRDCAPDSVVIEKIFFAKGAKAALSLGHARGVALLAAASEGVDIYECSALEVKKAVVGYGRADKRQVQAMVKMILHIQGELYPDSADALALALCHMNTIKFNEAIARGLRG